MEEVPGPTGRKKLQRRRLEVDSPSLITTVHGGPVLERAIGQKSTVVRSFYH